MMNKFDFTEGKWIYYPDHDEFHVETDNGYIAYVTKNEFNARLISCAPEMLMALIRLVNSGCYHCPDSDIINIANKNQCKGCGYFDNIQLIEKSTGKKWEEINE